MRQAEIHLAEPGEMGRQDDAAAVAGPAVHVQCGVVGREVGVAGVAEDALDEIQVRDQPARHEEAHLHPLLRGHPGYRRAHERAEQQAHHRLDRPLPPGGERQAPQLRRRTERLLQQPQEGVQRHPGLVPGDRQPAFRDVKHALRGAAVVDRIVEHPVVEPVARDEGVLPDIAIERQAQLTGEPVLVEYERLAGQADRGRCSAQGEQAVEIVLDPAVGGAEMIGQEPCLLPIAGEQIPRQVKEILVAGRRRRELDAHGRELEQNGADGGPTIGLADGTVGTETDGALEVHDGSGDDVRLATALSQRLTGVGFRQPASASALSSARRAATHMASGPTCVLPRAAARSPGPSPRGPRSSAPPRPGRSPGPRRRYCCPHRGARTPLPARSAWRAGQC